jgi:ABC-type phosphate transport system substrate-binding protein
MVISKNNASVTTVSKADAKRMILGQMSTWSGGQKVVVVLRGQQNPDRVALLQKLCGMSEAEYTRYEMQVMFTGRVAAKVQEEPSAAALKTFVKANPGAVGFVHETDVDKDLKTVLTVE